MQVRQEVQFLAEWMERALQDKEERCSKIAGWKCDTDIALILRAYEELDELIDIIKLFNNHSNKKSPEMIFDACADVANFVMMIADNYRSDQEVKPAMTRKPKETESVGEYRTRVEKQMNKLNEEHSNASRVMNECEHGIALCERAVDMLSDLPDYYDGPILDVYKLRYPIK